MEKKRALNENLVSGNISDADEEAIPRGRRDNAELRNEDTFDDSDPDLDGGRINEAKVPANTISVEEGRQDAD